MIEIMSPEVAEVMKALSPEHQDVIRRLLQATRTATYRETVVDICRSDIREAAERYFTVRPTTDREAACLVDLIYASLSEAEEREAGE